MENQEIYYIEESQSWICPITGRWKAICVGGGASGGGGATATSAGGTTSFGAIISAPGGLSTSDAVVSATGGISGYGGYTGYTYGGAPGAVVSSTVSITYGNGTVPPTLMSKGKPTAALGWGAGGGACTTTSGGDAPAPTAGRAGEIRTTIVTLTEGDIIACTIGAGGVAPTVANVIAANGADGVIVLQYLGV